MLHELEDWSKACFVTLTYSDGNLPEGGLLDKGELQRFFKRVRSKVGVLDESRRIKYYACGEYGERFGRPHYHAVVFGLGMDEKKIIEESWPFGFIKVGRVTRQSCRYVSKYIMKSPLGLGWKGYWYGLGKTPPFQVQSRGLGLSWIMANAEVVGERGLRYKGRQVCMPRYYIKKLRELGLLCDGVLEDARAEAVLRSREECATLEAEGIEWRDSEFMSRRYQEMQEARVEQIKSRDSLYAKRDVDNQ